MHIALFLGSLHVGGAERQFTYLARGLAGRGHRVSFLTMLGGGPLEAELAGVDGVKLHAFRRDGSGARLLWSAYRSLQSWLREHRPSVLYSALYHSNWIAASRAPKVECPVVWGIRTAADSLSRQQSLFMKLGRRHKTSVAAAISNSTRGLEVHQNLGYLPEQQLVIPNGVDIDRFRPDSARREQVRRQLELTSGQVLVGYAGRTGLVKGLDRFAEIALQAGQQESGLRFVAILPPGSTIPDAVREQFKVGRVSVLEGRQIEQLYPALDLFVCPSRAEGFPNGVAEAMASEVYPICFDVGDCARLVGDAGVVVPAGDVPAMLDRVHETAQQAQLPELRANARTRVAETFGVSAMVAATEQVLVDAAGRGSSEGGC